MLMEKKKYIYLGQKVTMLSYIFLILSHFNENFISTSALSKHQFWGNL